MTAAMPARPEITPGYRREADREIRAFTRDWTDRDDRIASLSYFGTFAFYFFTLWLTVQAWPVWWLVVPLIVINAFAGVRLYVLQHDCGHGSLYSTKRANDLAGHGLSVFTLTPYRVMQFNHNEHHSHLGNLEERETTEIFTMTLREWEEAGFWERLRYRLYRNPLLMIPVGGLLTYVFVYRWPKNAGRIDAAGVIAHNIGLALWIAAIWAMAGLPGLIILRGHGLHRGLHRRVPRLPAAQFRRHMVGPQTRPQPGARGAPGLFGARSRLVVGPRDRQHRLSRHPPFQRQHPLLPLRECHRALREKYEVQTIRWPEAIRSFTLKLWDEDQERLVPFPRAREQAWSRTTPDPWADLPLHPGKKLPPEAPVAGHVAQHPTALRTMSQ
jgi:omega-6 fatty acid desaturase (delta-12 desaturase)